MEVSGFGTAQPPAHHPEDDDFTQAGLLYRLMGNDERVRLVQRLADSLSLVSRNDIIERSVGHFRWAAPDFGEQLAAAIAKRQARA